VANLIRRDNYLSVGGCEGDDLCCIEEKKTNSCEDGAMSRAFDYKNMKRRKPAVVRIFTRAIYQNEFKENVLGSQIDSSHACFFPP
jgi:hypothetical protein